MTARRSLLLSLLGAIAVALVVAGGLAIGGGARAAPPPATAAPAPGGRLVVEFLDVGQGDATLVTSPAGKRMLVDGGPPEAGRRLAALLRQRGIASLDLVVLTHPHHDHVGGLRAAIRAAPPRLFLDPGLDHPLPAYEKLLDELERKRVPVKLAVRGRAIDLGGGARAEILWPPADPPRGLDLNDRSVVLRIVHGDVAFLLTGDAGKKAERKLLALDPGALRAKVLKVGHHGSRGSTTPAFLREVRPGLAVVSAGRGNDYGHPTKAVLGRLRKAGAELRRTDLEGTIVVESDGRDVTVRRAR